MAFYPMWFICSNPHHHVLPPLSFLVLVERSKSPSKCFILIGPLSSHWPLDEAFVREIYSLGSRCPFPDNFSFSLGAVRMRTCDTYQAVNTFLDLSALSQTKT